MVISRAKRAAGRTEQQTAHRALAALVVQQRAERPDAPDARPAPTSTAAPATRRPARRKTSNGRGQRRRPFGR